MPKCLCITSCWPYIAALKIVLQQIYTITLLSSKLPIERYICNALDDVPAPPAGLVDVVFYFDKCSVIII